MKDLKYQCMKCGTCCFEIEDSSGTKRIPLYPEEVDRLIEIAKHRGIEFTVIEDLVFPELNQKSILVLTYKIILDPKGHCPFFKTSEGCTIHESKPYACQAYPLSLKTIDAFNLEISVDSLCKWVIKHYDHLKDINLEQLKVIFKDEYPKAEKFFRKNKSLQLKLRQMETENKIKLARSITVEDFNTALKEWARLEIRTIE